MSDRAASRRLLVGPSIRTPGIRRPSRFTGSVGSSPGVDRYLFLNRRDPAGRPTIRLTERGLTGPVRAHRLHSFHATESTAQTRNYFLFGRCVPAVPWPIGASDHPIHQHLSMTSSRISASGGRARLGLELLFEVSTPAPMEISSPHACWSTIISTRSSSGCLRSSILARQGFRRFWTISPRMCSPWGKRSMRGDTEGV
jgi:hypothetical protein